MRPDTPNADNASDIPDKTIAEQQSPDTASTETGPGDQSLLMSPLSALVLAGIAAFAIWGVLEVMPSVFEIPERLREAGGNGPEELQRELLESSRTVGIWNASLSIALLAAALGLFLTIAEGKLRRRGLVVIAAGILVVVVSGAFAVGGGLLGGVLAASPALSDDPLVTTIIVQAAMWGCVGLGIGTGIGLAAALPKIHPRLLATCIVSGLLGGALAGLIFPLASSVLLPNARTELLMPDPGPSRLLWLGLSAIVIALVLTGMGKQKNKAAA